MSERMIELQRMKMLAQASRGGGSHQSPGKGSSAMMTMRQQQQHHNPQREAVVAVKSEDEQLQLFLQRMQRRDDDNDTRNGSLQIQTPMTNADSPGPTVPTALSRRFLHKQGVGFIDDTVCAIASAAADRFLATVLHQAVACRDQRLKGAEMVQGAREHRKRHMEQYQADAQERKRQILEKEQKRERNNLKAIEAVGGGDSAKKGGSGAKKEATTTEIKTVKKKKKGVAFDGSGNTPSAGGVTGPNPNNPQGAEESDDESHDSLDSEEEFYQSYYEGRDDGPVDDEDDETLKLRDIIRPLEAWDFYLAGKQCVDRSDDASSTDSVAGDKEDDTAAGAGATDDKPTGTAASAAATVVAEEDGKPQASIKEETNGEGFASPGAKATSAGAASSAASTPIKTEG